MESVNHLGEQRHERLVCGGWWAANYAYL